TPGARERLDATLESCGCGARTRRDPSTPAASGRDDTKSLCILLSSPPKWRDDSASSLEHQDTEFQKRRIPVHRRILASFQNFSLGDLGPFWICFAKENAQVSADAVSSDGPLSHSTKRRRRSRRGLLDRYTMGESLRAPRIASKSKRFSPFPSDACKEITRRGNAARDHVRRLRLRGAGLRPQPNDAVS